MYCENSCREPDRESLDGRAVGVIQLERKRAKTKRAGDELREAKNLK
jgi:hypothetical protein